MNVPRDQASPTPPGGGGGGWDGMGWTLPALVRQTPGRVGPPEAAQPSMKSRLVEDEPDEGLHYWSQRHGLTHRTHTGRSRSA